MDAERILRKLIDSGLVDAHDVVDGGLSIREASQRNQNYIVSRSTGPGYFVKYPASEDTRESLANEAAFYDAVWHGDLRSLQPAVPRFFREAGGADGLVLALCTPALNGHALAEASLIHGSTIATAIGEALASCHALPADHEARRAPFQHMLPWAFNLARPTADLFRTMSPLQLDVLRLIARNDEADTEFAAMRREWRWDVITHGDIRWVNMLGLVDATGSFTELKLIDWEGVGFGDAAWDVAGLFSAFLGHCLVTLPLDEADTPSAAAAMFADRLPEVRRPMTEAWAAYAAARELDADLAEDTLNRALRFTGLRLLQFAFEWAQVRAEMPRFALCSLQLALNIVTDTADGRAALVARG